MTGNVISRRLRKASREVDSFRYLIWIEERKDDALEAYALHREFMLRVDHCIKYSKEGKYERIRTIERRRKHLLKILYKRDGAHNDNCIAASLPARERMERRMRGELMITDITHHFAERNTLRYRTTQKIEDRSISLQEKQEALYCEYLSLLEKSRINGGVCSFSWRATETIRGLAAHFRARGSVHVKMGYLSSNNPNMYDLAIIELTIKAIMASLKKR